MKLATYARKKTITFEIYTQKRIIEFQSNTKYPTNSFKQLLSHDCPMEILTDNCNESGITIDLNDVQMLAPIPRSGKMLAIAGNYTKHIAETGKELVMAQSPKETSTLRLLVTTFKHGNVTSKGMSESVTTASKKLQPSNFIECTIKKTGTLTNTIGQCPLEFHETLS